MANNIIVIEEEKLNEMIKAAVREEFAKQQTHEDDNSELLTVEEACNLLSISRATLFNWKKEGTLPSQRIGGRVYFNRKDIINSAKKVNSNKQSV